jgi:hypothetical protein
MSFDPEMLCYCGREAQYANVSKEGSNTFQGERQLDDPAETHISRGSRRSRSKERMGPETAPTANSTPIARAQRRASDRHASSPVRWPRHSASTVVADVPTPRQEASGVSPWLAGCQRPLR